MEDALQWVSRVMVKDIACLMKKQFHQNIHFSTFFVLVRNESR